MQRQESERSTRYPVRSIWHLRCQKSWIWWKIPTSRRDDESGKRSSSNLPDRLSVSSQPTIRSPTFSISLAITSLPPNTELPGCKHSGCGRKLAAELPLRYKSPTCLPSRGKSGRTSRRCPIASSCTPLSTKMKAAISVTASGAVSARLDVHSDALQFHCGKPPPAADRAQPHQTWVASPAPPASESEEIT
jgi:hypothetical protein